MEEERREMIRESPDWWKIIGVTFLVAGGTIFLENQLKTGWLFYVPILIFAGVTIRNGVLKKQFKLLLLGITLVSTSLILIIIFMPSAFNTLQKLGVSSLIAGASWLVYFYLDGHIAAKKSYWSLLVSGLFFGGGVALLAKNVQLTDFVLWIGVGISVPMLIWGYTQKHFGLIIAGCIIFSCGVGVGIAWGENNAEINSLTRTGVMLITFALGWGGISVLSKRFLKNVAWWPLIPAGVLAMSGGGLFIGGGLGSSGQYVGNTLSVALILLGVYVLLLRSGFNRK